MDVKDLRVQLERARVLTWTLPYAYLQNDVFDKLSDLIVDIKKETQEESTVGIYGSCVHNSIIEAKDGDYRFLTATVMFSLVILLVILVAKIDEWADKHWDD